MELVRFLPLSLDVTMEHDFMTTTINATATNAQSREPTRELTEDQLAQVSGGGAKRGAETKRSAGDGIRVFHLWQRALDILNQVLLSSREFLSRTTLG